MSDLSINVESKPSNIIELFGYVRYSEFISIINNPDYTTVLRTYPQCTTKDAAHTMFFAGYINGIRSERSRKKKKN